MREAWKDVVGYEGIYQVSNLGRIKRLLPYRNTTYYGKILKQTKATNGYLRIELNHKGKSKIYAGHRLAAKAFIPNPENNPQINHKNGIKDDNRLENLEWVTGSENQLHRSRVLGKVLVKKMGHLN